MTSIIRSIYSPQGNIIVTNDERGLVFTLPKGMYGDRLKAWKFNHKAELDEIQTK